VINPQPGAAIYEQIAAGLREQIRTGQLRPGQPIPSERTLAQLHGVARETVKKAHDLLRAEGLLERRRGQTLLVREQPEVRDLTPPAGATVTARSATKRERHDMALPDGVPLLVVTTVDGRMAVYPADRWRLRWPGP
jgi:DNA-binding transcriptional regulator YhcF (GntR family)